MSNLITERSRRLVTPCQTPISTSRRFPVAWPARQARSAAVDPFPSGRFGFSPQHCIARWETGKVQNGSMHWLRMTGSAAAEWYAAGGNPPVDFVFIDGDHSYDVVRADWEGWAPLVAKGGIIALHDSCFTDRPIQDAGSARFTEEVILPHPSFRLLERVDTLTVVSRCST